MARDTSQLLKTGAGLLAAGILFTALIDTVFGGLSRHGPHTDGGWILLVFALGCMPLGLLLLVLGGAKWFGARRP